MKSPQQLAEQLARQWQRSDWREAQLLPNPTAWPLQLAIGAPSAQSFQGAGPALRQHLQAWRATAEGGPGSVQWAPRSYQGGAAPLDVPLHWTLARPSDAIAAIARFAGPSHAGIAADYQALATVLAQVDACFHRLLLRRLALWRHLPTSQVVTATRMALQLAPGCAAGKPLRALAVAGNDSKFFERHDSLLKALLDERFGGEASRQGLTSFLGASPEGEHWVLVAPLADGLLPFRRQRVTTTELHATALPASRILLVENERSLHQLPLPLPGTIAILGSGLNLAWLAAPWLQASHVAYWGDLDTWGLAMLATARRHLPHLHTLLMDRDTFDAYAHLAVNEAVACDALPFDALHPHEAALAQHLRSLERGRLEQEFLPAHAVAAALRGWAVDE
ncbi:MAG: Wadjet anti-phage system protein JetD domain-containing protein, partial [Giesbergeria sp.]